MRWLLLVPFLLLAGCGQPKTDQQKLDAAEADKSRAEFSAQQVLDQIEPRIAAWRAMSPEPREEKGKEFGPQLEQALAQVQGTSSQNKALLWLADWRMHYQHGVGVGACLDELERSPFPKLKSSGERLRVEWLLRTGDLPRARVRADAITQKIPEWSFLNDLVKLHELVGQPPPRTAAKNLSGGPDDPAAERSEPWMVYLFTETLNDESVFLLKQWLAEAARPEYGGKARIVCVTNEATPLGAITKTHDLPGAAQLLDLLWVSPAVAGDAEQWRAAWRLPPRLVTAALLGPGPKRMILAISDDPTDLRALQLAK